MRFLATQPAVSSAAADGRRVRAALGRCASPRRRGASLVLIVLLLPIFVGMVAFAVDFGLMTLQRAQIQNAVDAGTLAASLQLRVDPTAITDAEAVAREYVQYNRVGSQIVVPEEAIDVEVGRWDDQSHQFTATEVDPNAVRVFARQDNEPYFFAQIFGHTSFGAPAEAIATASTSELDVMLVLDLSGSMADEGRIEALRNSAPSFAGIIDNMEGDNYMGVMGLSADPGSYAGSNAYDSGLHPTNNHHVGVLESVLTNNFGQLQSVTLGAANLVPQKYQPYTGTGAALGDAAHYLANGAEARANAEKIIVLMSDGLANRPTGSGPAYAQSMAVYAAGLDITVYTISLGNDADLVLMGQIAQLTGGLHFDATGSGEEDLTAALTTAFEAIGAAIKRNQLVQ